MGDTPGNAAGRRSSELSRRGRDLAAGKVITAADVQCAAERAETSRQRDLDAHRRDEHRHYQAAIAHSASMSA